MIKPLTDNPGEAEAAAELEDLASAFEQIVDGRRAVFVGAAMGRVLGETISDPEVLGAALNTLALNAIRGHQQTCDHPVTKH